MRNPEIGSDGRSHRQRRRAPTDPAKVDLCDFSDYNALDPKLLSLPTLVAPPENFARLHARIGTGHKAIESEDHIADACCNLGTLEHDHGKVARAFDCLTTALQHDPRHFESHFNFAYLYFKTEDLRLARVRELAPEDDTPEIGDLLASVQNALKLSVGRRGTTRH